MTFIHYGGKFYRLVHPRPTVIIGTLCEDGRVNLMPASWNMPISEEPETIGVSVYKETFTYRCLKFHPYATINVPGPELLDLTYSLGSVSGKDVDKVKKFNVELVESEKINVPGMAKAIAIYETRIYNQIDVGECTLFVFEVLKSKVRDGITNQSGLDLRKTNLLLHGSGKIFHYVDKSMLSARELE
ncbi:flavin reductase family protein [Sulfolobus acidocaldarius]|uniref:Flavin reductase like domain-containing protein n=4 Tax=Sulfolobus acidocaldarius TaxID=2285 RepID=Q4J849_SULAC|nr:flavin reductase family protein [Sulfolobus acidocaldarius]AAY81028.1 hypothetical protein Saci_1722 [Sulfolobus acidocaldarius DSM 639]AGE71634.1 hypothetical protein SacN8_08370 [Sulfolobus acidocaldarius N8]AGE73908.1 hypothetical protein SacRon12I_08385 [Sulfolobus acidocaldarius Ron12/I]ALU30151.1 flavin reductase [Sulfolobus acidocaldarius]ALU30845.1 flavin reductase [Sulfolobus acidocaldarius]